MMEPRGGKGQSGVLVLKAKAIQRLLGGHQRSPFILSYFIFHAGALLSSLQLKCFDHRQWDSAVGLGHLPFAHSCCHAGALGKSQLNVGSAASFRTECSRKN